MPKDQKRRRSDRRGPTTTYRKKQYDLFGGFKKDDRKDRKTRRSDRKRGGKRRSKRRYD